MSRRNEGFYEIAWAARTEVFKLLQKQGPKNLAESLHELIEFDKANKIELGGEIVRDPQTGLASKDFNGQVHFVPIERIYQQPSFPMREFFRFFGGDEIDNEAEELPHDMVPPAFIASMMDEGFDAIVELGTGYGRRLFEIYLMRDGHVPKMLGGEFTGTGQKLGQNLAKLEPSLDIEFFSFDHLSPDVEPFGDCNRILLFTCHSIEQVREIPQTYFEQLTSAAREVVAVHFEPFGFQCGPDSEVSRQHREFAKKYDYNRNLYEVMNEAYQRGAIELVWLARNILLIQPDNPSSLAVWRSGP